MKMREAAIISCSTSTLAYMESWSNVNNEVETCNVYGQMGDHYWRMAKQGERPTRHNGESVEHVCQHIDDESFGHHDEYTQDSAARFAFAYYMDRMPQLIRARLAQLGG